MALINGANEDVAFRTAYLTAIQISNAQSCDEVLHKYSLTCDN